MEAGVDAVGRNRTDQAGGTGPLPAELVLGATPVLKEPRLLDGRLFWLEQLPAQRGRTTLRLRTRTGAELELTPELDLRSRIHGYGGGVYCVARKSAGGGTGADERGNDSRSMADLRADERPAEGEHPGHAPLGSWTEGPTVVVVAEGGRSLWRLDLPDDPGNVPLPAPVRLTPASDAQHDGEPALFGDGLIDPARQRWIGVCEHNDRDRLVSVPLAGGTPQVLWESPDFCGYAVLSPSGCHLAWVSWQQPCMPWDRSVLWLGRFDAGGALTDVRPIAGSTPGPGQAISVFQPLWAGPDLMVAGDRSGWWNLEMLENAVSLSPEAAPEWRPLLPMQAEFAMPQWVYGMRTTAWDGQRLVAACCRDGRWELGALVPTGDGAATAADTPGADTPAALAETTNPGQRDGASEAASPSDPPAPASSSGALRGALRWQPIPLPFDDLAALDAQDGRVVAIASGPVDGPGLLELTLQRPCRQKRRAETLADSPEEALQQPAEAWLEDLPVAWTHRPAVPALLAPDQISRPEPLRFTGHGGRPTHAWYYPPRDGASPASPLLVRGHSGPTGMARTGLSLAIQFWTSRGWGVVDVNYGGSTGFGRAYRERLDGLWGVVDVDDCLAAARAVVEAGHADPDRIAMEGSSASGFTVLAAMARGDTLRAGAIRYPVTDLTALAECDHRFEARYFDALVGPWPSARAIYEQRSPLQQVERIHAPLLFFHGLDDTVVPAQQSIAMVERLKARGVPVELQLFEGEGHGFRDGAVQRQVLERSEAFFRERFGLGAGG